jgi:hypothetical protein
MPRILRLTLLAALSVLGVLATSAHAAATCSDKNVCLTTTSPDATVSAGGWTRYEAVLENRSTSTLTHATITFTASNGTPAAPLPAGCSAAGSVLTCNVGTIAGNSTARVTDVVFKAGATAGQTVTTVAGFNNGTSDPDPGRQDTITTSTVATAPPTGTALSWIPGGAVADLGTTDPSQTIAVHIPAQKDPITAQLGKDLLTPFTCPKGAVCRGGGWLTATVPFAYSNDALQFRLHWSPGLVSKKQTAKNFVVWHLSDSGVLEQISRKCPSANPTAAQLPCIGNVTVGPNGADATLFTTHNGRMR